MEARELRALLEAASRELAAVVAEFPQAQADSESHQASLLSSEVSHAHRAVEDACFAWSSAAGAEPSEDVRQALALRAKAARARDAAEAELSSLQGERIELLGRLQRLSAMQSQEVEDVSRAEESAAAASAALQEEEAGGGGGGAAAAPCRRGEALQQEVQELREEVDAKNRRLRVCNESLHKLARTHRVIRQRHARSLAEGEQAREIFAVQQHTQEHFRNVSEQISEVEQLLLGARRDCDEKARVMQKEWAEHEARYQEQEAALEARLADMHRSYEERWRAAEAEHRSRLESQARIESEARMTFSRDATRLDAEREGVAAASRSEAERQRRRVEEYRDEAAKALEQQVSEKRRVLQAKADLVRERCDAMQKQHQRKADQYRRDFRQYQDNLGKVRETYRSKHAQLHSLVSTREASPRPPSTPRDARLQTQPPFRATSALAPPPFSHRGMRAAARTA